MDTRLKILSLADAAGLRVPLLVAGYFDPLTADHAARLEALGGQLTVTLLEPEQPLAAGAGARRVAGRAALGGARDCGRCPRRSGGRPHRGRNGGRYRRSPGIGGADPFAAGMTILVVRLGAMGDILHTLPAVTGLHWAYPQARIHWVVEPRWQVLLEGNPALASVIPLDRRSWSSIRAVRAQLRALRIDAAYDFQGLIKSALVAWQSGAREVTGYEAGQLREPLARFFYSRRRPVTAAHVVDQHLELASVKAPTVLSLPAGRAEGELPLGRFVLASPFAGWRSKQWPLEHFADLARRLPVPLVLNVPPSEAGQVAAMPNTVLHCSSIEGLIDATRRATAVIGVDSGPLHLAAALGKRGVAIFGGTDPARNGPYGGTIGVLRSPRAVTSYRRGDDIDPVMREITPEQVYAGIAPLLGL